ncbi:MAG TPA: ABC transporter ATP-binding protein, partial [Streptosporangiaceae bacterium]
GPSGCGKTTTLRMIAGFELPTSGTISIDGEDVTNQDAALLRRKIGYVIQQAGLFPHRTIEDNIATVPLLEGWNKAKARDRARELMDLVGLDADMARRYPYQLSGGQQQRVGVARALAADPPVLLMDEPFSAVDPIVRSSLQDELIRLQAELHKTVVLVTHDVEEAIKVGDQVAVFYPHGKIAQLDTPQRLLGAPADEYVENFLGFDRGIRRLAFFSAGQLDLENGTVLPGDTTVEQARAAAQRCGESWVLVTDGNGKPQGWFALADLDSQPGRETLGTLSLPLAPLGHTFQVGRDSLRAALDATVLSRTGRAAGVDDQGRVLGITTYDRLRAAIQTAEQAGLDGHPDQPVFRGARTTPEAVTAAREGSAESAGEGVRPS